VEQHFGVVNLGTTQSYIFWSRILNLVKEQDFFILICN